MMLKKKILLVMLTLAVSFSACMKGEVYDREAQTKIDNQAIEKFIADQKLTDVKQNNGVYYKILKEGTGTQPVELTDELTVNYELRLLNGTLVEKTTTEPAVFVLNSVIEGWQKGMPLIKEGGQIRLLIPSPLAYANFSTGSIPANSPLDFTITLVKLTKKSTTND